MSVRIICINKDSGNHYDPHEAITHLGWINENDNSRGRLTRQEMVKFIDGGGQAYVKDAYGNVAYLITVTSISGLRYVKTEPDSTTSNNLLELREC